MTEQGPEPTATDQPEETPARPTAPEPPPAPGEGEEAPTENPPARPTAPEPPPAE